MCSEEIGFVSLQNSMLPKVTRKMRNIDAQITSYDIIKNHDIDHSKIAATSAIIQLNSI